MKKILLFIVGVLTLNASAQNCSELFISEYVEGWSNNKALEIYNPTANPINLGGYFVARYSNGATTATVANATLVYGSDVSGGGTGLYFANTSYVGEVISKNRAFILSMIF